VDFRRGLLILRHWWLVLVVGTLLGAGATYVVSKAQPSVYEATALLEEGSGLPTTGGGPDLGAQQASWGRAAQDAVLMHTTPVAQAAIARAGLRSSVDPGALLKNSVVLAALQSPIITIHVRWSDPRTASRLASGLANAFVAQRGKMGTVGFTVAFATLQKEISYYNTESAAAQRSTSPTRAQRLAYDGQVLVGLQNSVNDINLRAAGITASIVVAQEAVTPGDPISPRTTVNVAVAAVLVLLVLLAVAVLSEVLSAKPRDPAEAAAALGLELLGTIAPANAGAVTPILSAPSSPAADEYRLLRVALGLGDSATEGASVVVVAALHQGDGATTMATNLASIAARAQERTVLVDANLRRPALAEHLATPGATGLSDLLRGEGDLRALLQEGPLPLLHVLGAGAKPADAIDLLGSHSFASLLTKLRTVVDLIVIDAGALDVADPTLVARYGDRTLLVARMGGLATNGPALESDRKRVDALVGSGTRRAALALTLFVTPTVAERAPGRALSSSDVPPVRPTGSAGKTVSRDDVEKAATESGVVAG